MNRSDDGDHDDDDGHHDDGHFLRRNFVTFEHECVDIFQHDDDHDDHHDYHHDGHYHDCHGDGHFLSRVTDSCHF